MTKQWKVLRNIIVASAMIVLAACGGADKSAPNKLPPPAVNIPPLIVNGNTDVSEHAPDGALVYDVNDVNTGTDIDGNGDPIRYSIIGGNTGNAFAIDPATGQVRVSDPADFASSDQYVLSIQADDGLFQATADITINVSRIVSGLDSRPSNLTCVAASRPIPAGSNYSLEPVYTNLPAFALPVAMLQAPGDMGWWYVVELGGKVKRFANTANVDTASTFIDISDRVDMTFEGGLLGMAFHPDYPNTPYVYLSYTASSTSAALESRVSRFVLQANGTLDANSEQPILRLDQPFANHNGGNIAFGPDGFLYFGLGDGGGGGDPYGNAQNTKTLLGSMLRLDVNVTSAEENAGIFYKIPNDPQTGNPFAGNPRCVNGAGSQDCPEIFAWGLRNPWRWSFDLLTGELWVGDVGQSAWEEVNRIQKGMNYVWNICEGTHDFKQSSPPIDCANPPTGMVPPVVEYGHVDGNNSITGGYVYRGTDNPGLIGKYLYGDFGSKRIWALDFSTSPAVPKELLVSPVTFVTFAQDQQGEIFIPNFYQGGQSQRRILKLVETGSGSPGNFPTLLSQTGCVDTSTPNQPQPMPGVIPYEVNVPFWSDGADKERYLAIPDGTTMSIESNGHWQLPIGSVLVKNIRIGTQLVETRLLMRHSDGGWGGYAYEWNAAGTDATLVDGSKTVDVNGQTWVIPSRAECMKCHTNVAGISLGTETVQLNRDKVYATTGRTANQIDTFNAIGMIDPPLAASASSLGLPAMPNPYDQMADDHFRARAWLHTNCAYCHQPSGPTPVNMDMRYATAGADMNVCDVIPIEDLGLGSAARRIAPGNPANSVLMVRIQDRDPLAHIMMPPLGSTLVDTAAVNLLDAWITGMGNTCPP